MTTPTSEYGYISRQENTVTVITIDAKSVDYRNAEAYKNIIGAVAASAVQGGTLLLNLEHVTFMDSSGLGILLFARRTLEAKQGGLAACNVQGYVVNLFKLTSLDRVVKLYPNEELALMALDKAAVASV